MNLSTFCGRLLLTCTALFPVAAGAGQATQFCLDGEFNLGKQMQGYSFDDYWVPMRWCVVTEDDSNRVFFSAQGKSNPGMDGDWSVAYLPPDLVRIVNRDDPPDVEFHGTNNLEEALELRRLDPRRLAEEVTATPDWGKAHPDTQVLLKDGKVVRVYVQAPLPYYGNSNFAWQWTWHSDDEVDVTLGDPAGGIVQFFRGSGSWRDVPADEANRYWQATDGADPIEVPGENWPSRVNMQVINLTDDVYLVRGVRTGFQHLVVDTSDGLIVADAPTGWIEFQHIPPADLVPGSGEYGLSERFIEYMAQEFEGRPVHAVALTHFHGDHAAGAPAFAAVGADVYAPAFTARFLSDTAYDFDVKPVEEVVEIGDDDNRVRFMTMNENPHVFEMLGVWAVDRGYFFVSDIHVPRSDDPQPAAHRVETECWFANWAVENLPEDVQVVNSHSPTITPVSRLVRYVESEACGARP
ncbi:MAG: MBL fold metallo-hydrolase [Woeseiaceae bacterium]|nr:MBL fold metallo-hydrolase [Woeseiaceae bacterium]